MTDGTDTIIIFKNKAKTPSIQYNEALMEVANWVLHTDNGYRGFSSLRREPLTKLLIEEFDLNEDDFDIIHPFDIYF